MVKMDSTKQQQVNSKEQDIKDLYENFTGIGNEQSPAIAAIRTLLHTIENHDGNTVNQLITEVKEAIRIVESETTGKFKLAVSSACAQFLRFATLNIGDIDTKEIAVYKQRMGEDGGKYLARCEKSIGKVATLGVPFIFDGAHILVHSNSQVVLETLKAVPEHIQFTVYITTSNKVKAVKSFKNDKINPPELEEFKDELAEKSNINSSFVHDSEIGYMMESIDLVLVGAEAVVKNGGILNKVGTLSLAICAKEMNKPLYVLAESFKFSLLYPLNQKDIPSCFRYGDDAKVRVDYTPPKYITMLITDRGLLTPTAVCDELIEMYV